MTNDISSDVVDVWRISIKLLNFENYVFLLIFSTFELQTHKKIVYGS